MSYFSTVIMRMERENPNLLPSIHQGSTILVGSDYSGENNFEHYESLAFVFADLEQCVAWEQNRTQLRRKFLPNGRRLSYKRLGDKHRRQALLPFLNAANSIPGLVVTILVDKRIPSLFEQESRLRLDSPEFAEYSHWDSAVFEKLLRVLHLVSFFVAGLSRPNQNVLWFTDEDPIIANKQRAEEVTKLFSNLCRHYLKHDLKHAQIATTKSDTGKRDIEDLVAIADLAAGALCRLLTEYQNIGWRLNTELIVPPPQRLPEKARVIMDWFADYSQPLKRLAYIIEEREPGEVYLRLRCLRFHQVPRSTGINHCTRLS